MPDESAPTAASNSGLDDLERRLAAFENATQRLNRTVAQGQELVDGAIPAAAARPGTRRLSGATRLGLDEVSGLRPAVAAQGPQTGALTARSRGAPTQPVPFTSAHGRPQIAQRNEAAPPVRKPAPPRRLRQLTARPWLLAVSAALLVLLVMLWLSPSFAVLPDAAIFAEISSARASGPGKVVRLLALPGQKVQGGQELMTLAPRVAAEVPVKPVLAPQSGTLLVWRVNVDDLVNANDAVADIASEGTLRVEAVVPPSLEAKVAVGHRVVIRPMGGGTSHDGTVERVLAAGESSAYFSDPVRRARQRILVILDPTTAPPQAGQAAQVVVLGERPGWLTMLRLLVRESRPW